jgi:putative DNA primase/helicase
MSTHKSLITLGERRVRVLHYQRIHQPEEEFVFERIVDEPPDLTQQRMNDVGNAQRFIAMFGADVRYAAELKRWLVWDGRRWKIDIANEVQGLAKLSMLEYLWQSGETLNKEMLRFAERSLNVPRLRHLLEAAQSEPGIPVEISRLDCHPLVLNLQFGHRRARSASPRAAADQACRR